jgi:hypothetical protein
MILFIDSERIGEEEVMAYFEILSQQSLKGMRKISENLRLISVLAEIQTRHLPNISQKNNCLKQISIF